MRWLRGLASLVGLALLLVGVPVALLRLGTAVPTDPAVWLRPDDGRVLLGLLTIFGWAAWVCLAVAVVVELLGALRGVRVRLPGLGWAQGVAGVLVVGVLGMMPVSPARAESSGPAPAKPVVVAAPQAGATPVARPAPAAPRADQVVHTVKPGESLWQIAEQRYGDGMRWRSIYEANRSIVRDPDVIEPGWKLVLPGLRAKQPQVKGKPVEPRPVPRTESRRELPSGPQPEPRPAEVPVVAADLADAEAPAVAPLALGVGALLGAGILLAADARRLVRDLRRPPGRRYVTAGTAARRLETVVAAQAPILTRDDLLAAQRAVAAHCRSGSLPALDHVRLGEQVRFVFTEPAGAAPIGFRTEGDAWVVDRGGLPFLADDGEIAWPSLVTVGRAGDDWVLVDPASWPVGVEGEAAPVLASWLVELGCAGVRVATTSELEPVVARSALESVTIYDDVSDLLAWVERRAADTGGCAAVIRLDPDRAPALEPVVVLLPQRPDDGMVARLEAAAQSPTVGLVLPGTGAARVHTARGTLETAGATLSLDLQKLESPALDAVVALLEHANDAPTEPAWWWAAETDNITWLSPRPDSPLLAPDKERLVSDPPVRDHPTLLLLGPIELHGARGKEPSRARRQCIEYAAWLLEHPGATASQMADALIVAEGTRRSNMSRLRTWLGTAPDGDDYLPDAYSGRIRLDERVSSDWAELSLLVAPGVNRLSARTLATALDLVRGAPLADAAPTQWYWAEPLRSDMRAAIRDIALRLAELALDDGDADLARWATARGLTASPQDELLIGARIRAEHRSGNQAEVERLALRLSQQARMLGVDLSDETVVLLQEVMEGRARARRAWS